MENRIEKNIDYYKCNMIKITKLVGDIYYDMYTESFNADKYNQYKKRFPEAEKIMKYLHSKQIIYTDYYYNIFKWISSPPDGKLADKIFNLFFKGDKKCTKCGEIKARTEFYSYKSNRGKGKDRLKSKCKSCEIIEVKKWQKRNILKKTEIKQCLKCERILPVTSFNKKSSAIDGLQVWCRNCQAKANKKRIIKRLDKKINITKICNVCKKEKILSEFCKNKRAKDKVDYTCKECNNKKGNLYRQKYKKINSRITINKTDLKVCSKCKKTLSVLNFHKSLYTKDGLRHSCKKCTSKINAKNYKNKKAKILQDKKIIIKVNNKNAEKRILQLNKEIKLEREQTIVTRLKNFFKKIF